MRDKIFVTDKADIRNSYLKRLLEEEGYIVLDYGENTYEFMGTVVYIFSPSRVIDLDTAETVKSGSVVFAFRLGEHVAEEFLMRNIKFINLLDDELFAHKNAALTAEGALAIIIRETEKSLATGKILVVGYGRLGKALTKLLTGCGNAVTAATSSATEQILADVFLDGRHFPVEELKERIGAYDVVVNTVPVRLLRRDTLERANCSALLLDLASKPGGIDFDAATELKLKTIHALGLPAQAAPLDAGRYLMQRIFRAL